ncbi:response regulator transcription factor [Pseudomonas sp. RT6P73]
MKLLVVEDETLVRRQLHSFLSKSGHAVDAVANAEEALALTVQSHHDLALIDLGLPGISGLELIRQLRARGQHYPILILSARSNWQDKVKGLEAGANDYLVKPFQFDELNTRLSVLLRTSCGSTPPTLVAGPLALHLNSQQASLDERPLTLTTYEYRILEYLMRHPQQLVAKERLMELHLNDDAHDPNVLERLMDHLRLKLEGLNGFTPIDGVRDQGYLFTERCR